MNSHFQVALYLLSSTRSQEEVLGEQTWNMLKVRTPFRVSGFGHRVWGVGRGVLGIECRVWGVWGAGCRVQGVGCRVWVVGCRL